MVFWFFYSFQPRTFEFAIVYFMVAAVLLSSLDITYTNQLLDIPLVHYLAKLSFPMFLNQSWVRKVLIQIDIKHYGFGYAECMLIFVGSTIVVSVICMLVMDFLMKQLRKIWAKTERTY